MTHGEIFIKVWTHFVSEKAPHSHDKVNGIRYRTAEGRRCVIGILIPDELYTPELEGQDILEVCKKFSIIAKLFTGVDRKFLRDLQNVHDKETTITNFSRDIEAGLKKFSKNWKL